MPRPAKWPFQRGEHGAISQQPTVMIREDVIFPLTIPSGDVYPVCQLLLPTILTRTPTLPFCDLVLRTFDSSRPLNSPTQSAREHNDIPPGVFDQRYRQFLPIVSPIGAISEYMHLDRGALEVESALRGDVRRQRSPSVRQTDSRTCHRPQTIAS